MRVIFAGTPDFAAVALRAVIAAGHQVVMVLTQPDRASGRGLALRPSPVKDTAMAAAIEVLQPASLRDAAVLERLRAAAAEVIVVAAYGLILPPAVLGLPTFGCINIHASLLPRWRGAAPIQRAILAGDTEIGVSIMQMEAGLDNGPLLMSASQPIHNDDTAASLHDRMAQQGAALIVDVLPRLPLTAQPQSDFGVTYAEKISKAEAWLDWRQTAVQLERQVRAFNPSPGATCSVDGSLLKVWSSGVVSGSGAPGAILAADRSGIIVACGEGALRLVELQKSGGKRLPVAQFIAGHRIMKGACCALTAA